MHVVKSAIVDYLNYAKDVLGIKHLFFSGVQVTSKKIVISVVDLNEFSASEHELLNKMISALNIDSLTTAVTDASNIHLYKPQFLLK